MIAITYWYIDSYKLLTMYEVTINVIKALAKSKPILLGTCEFF